MIVSAFFYLWYAIPVHDGFFNHWNHTVLPHWTPAVNEKYKQQIGKSFDAENGEHHSRHFPRRGLYSSSDTDTLKSQFREMLAVGINVAVVSWWGRPEITGGDSQGTSTDEKMAGMLSAAEETGMKIAFHLEPYEGRSAQSFSDDVYYIIDKYGGSQSLHRIDGRVKFWIYDSYHISASDWEKVLKPLHSLGYFVGLILNESDVESLIRGQFQGGYTYFASIGFSYGSTPRNWPQICEKLRKSGLSCDISIGPGYDDEKIRPWNKANTKERGGGSYLRAMWQSAALVGDSISITSFNEWGEGTQIEPAKCYGDLYMQIIKEELKTTSLQQKEGEL